MHHLPIIKGRGAQTNPNNPFSHHQKVENVFDDLADGIQKVDGEQKTKYLTTNAKTIVNKVDSPDVGFDHSMNPYQGCEHGCVYCYARNTHPYWGQSAGLDFESVIYVKHNAPELLAKKLMSKNWNGAQIMLSGNTDCYQPIEKKMQITRRMLQVMLRYRNPTGIVTKNQLILRDMDILKKMRDKRLIKVAISLNTLSEKLRLKLEPRATSVLSRLKTIETLVKNDIPVKVLIAPIIPGLNDHEIMGLVKKLSQLGIHDANYIIVRLNGDVAEIFEQWLKRTFPDRAQKVMNLIADAHGGQVNDSRFGKRMKGEGNYVESIRQQFQLAKRKYFKEPETSTEFDFTLYHKMKNPQRTLF